MLLKHLETNKPKSIELYTDGSTAPRYIIF